MIKLTLVMTEQEAEVLREICSLIGGNPNGPRGFMDEIKGALSDNYVKWREGYYVRCGSLDLSDGWPCNPRVIKCERLD